MQKTIIGFFDDYSYAEKAQKEIKSLGLADTDVNMLSANSKGKSKSSRIEDISLGERIRRFFSGMGDDSKNDMHYYAEGVRRGGVTLQVKADESRVDEISDILNRNGAVDIDRKAQYFKESGFSGYDWSSAPLTSDESLQYKNQYSDWEKNRFTDSDQVIPVVEEKVNVGKRAIEKGRVRIYTHVTETPIDQDLRLRDERVDVERTPVDRPVSAADMDAFKEGEIELRETSEEAVVEKEARVVEEIRIHKDAQERTEHIHETARRTDVEIDRSNDLKDRRAKSDRDLR